MSMAGTTSDWIEQMFHGWLKDKYGLGWQLSQKQRPFHVQDGWYKVICYHDSSQGFSKIFYVKRKENGVISIKEL